MNKRAIFLDIDGVLNCSSHDPAIKSRSSFDGYHHGMDRVRVQRLARIVKATAADIILISSWKEYWKPNYHYPPLPVPFFYDPYNVDPRVLGRYINNHLREKGDGLKALDKTKDRGHNKYDKRGNGIMDWLDAHPDYTSFVILDDEFYNGNYDNPRLTPHVVMVDYKVGLTDENVNEAIKILEEV